jgi:hypothetical protein
VAKLEDALHKSFKLLQCQIKAGTAPPSLAEKQLQKT